MRHSVPKKLQFESRPIADSRAVVVEGNVRFTILTSRCIRVEYNRKGLFEDRPSQVFWFRRQEVPAYEVTRTIKALTISTDDLSLSYDLRKGTLSPKSLRIQLRKTGTVWRLGDKDEDNLGGTGRTLDNVEGSVERENGLLSRAGWAVVDDTQSLVFDESCWLAERKPGNVDLYFFGYGTDYHQCVKDYCKLAGRVPLIPRWALGNWWSRYWAYSDRELLALMDEFRTRQIPLSVCVVDMDWHVTKNPYGGGWTGYTWEKKYFPQPARFLKEMHDRFGLKVSLNLHPADGVRAHEKTYPQMARHMGIGPKTKEAIPFDAADPRFMEGYFRYLHHPHEKIGIDFWWMDWQQGQKCRLSGLDPLWWLNHLHHYDLMRDGRTRPFVFSRWGGLGNHRYQIGFSGDTVVNWKALQFQPHFTASASNVAYAWWSHDIGGHFFGYEDPELYTRWVQYGVFSPILRIHTSKNKFQSRHPWDHGTAACQLASEAFRLRHRLIPYLYSMNRKTHVDSLPLVRPMYWSHPDKEQAYHCPNQYWFGTELIAAPFVTPIDRTTRQSRQVVWLPKGDWFDFFSGTWFQGDRFHARYGPLEETPVFARAGAIVPMETRDTWCSQTNPGNVLAEVFPGADNSFTMYEDDGETLAHQKGRAAETKITQTYRGKSMVLRIGPATGDTRLVPSKRSWILRIKAVSEPSSVQVLRGKRRAAVEHDYDPAAAVLTITVPPVPVTDPLTITLKARGRDVCVRDDRFASRMQKVIGTFDLHSNAKERIYKSFVEERTNPARLSDVRTELSDAQMRCLCEQLYGAGVDVINHTGVANARLILWNNAKSRLVKYRHVRGLGQGVRHATVPGLLVIPLGGGKEWREELRTTEGPWSTTLDYGRGYACVVKGRGVQAHVDT